MINQFACIQKDVMENKEKTLATYSKQFKESCTSVICMGIKVSIAQVMVKSQMPKKGQWYFEESIGIVALEAIKSKNSKS